MPEPLSAVKKDLDAAEAAIPRMATARSFAAYEAAWKEFLNSTEKAWNKLEKACSAISTKAKPWLGGYISCRRTDELLRYLQHARNADQHGLEEIVEYDPGEYSVKIGKPGESVYIHSMEIGRDGRLKRYAGSATPEIVDRAPTIRALVVEDRGTKYEVPSEHLGLPLHNTSPVSMARTGLKFYRDTVDEALERFFRT